MSLLPPFPSTAASLRVAGCLAPLAAAADPGPGEEEVGRLEGECVREEITRENQGRDGRFDYNPPWLGSLGSYTPLFVTLVLSPPSWC
jgi:hypothetical protein